MNKIYKTVWNALRHCLVVVNEATKSLGGQSSGSGRHQGSICAQTPARHRIQSKKCLSHKLLAKSPLVLALISIFGFSVSLPSKAQDVYEYDKYESYTFGDLKDFSLFSALGTKSLTMGEVNSPNGQIFIIPSQRVEDGGSDGIWTPEDYYHTTFVSKSITIGNMRLETGTFDIHGDVSIVGKTDNAEVIRAIENEDWTAWDSFRDDPGVLLLTNTQTFEPGIIHGNLTTSLLHTGGTTNDRFQEEGIYNGRIIIEGDLIADNVVLDSPFGFDTQADYLEVLGQTMISNNLYNNGFLKAEKVTVNGTFYNGYGEFNNFKDPEATAQQPTDWIGTHITELNSLNIVNNSNLKVETLTNTREQTYTQTFGTIQVKNNWFTNSTINMSGGIINEDSLGPDKNLGINNVFNITGGTLIVGDLNFDSTVNLSQDGKIQTDIESIFINPDGDPEALNYIGLNASEPESVKASLTKWFTNYVSGTLRTDLEDHVNFNGGSIVVSGFGKITETQYRDLLEAFKEAFLNSIRKDLLQA